MSRALVKPTKKRKPPRATLEQKIQIIDYFHRSNRPQLETVDSFRHKVAILTLTFNEWLKNEEEYRERYRELDTQFEKYAKRKVTYKYDNINRAMDLLVQQRLALGEEITEPILRNYWQIYAYQFGVENPKRLVGFSHGWLSQFKKRHGLSRLKLKLTGDLTTSTNEKLLADPTSKDDSQRENGGSGSISLAENLAPPPLEPVEPQGHFQPQLALTFPHNVLYLALSPVQPGRQFYMDPVDSVESAESAESLESAMQLSLNTRKPFSAEDIDRFFVNVADRFFQDHQYDFPQTVHLYEEFKSSFTSERLIKLRSTKERAAERLSESLSANSRAFMVNQARRSLRNGPLSSQALLQQEPAQLIPDGRQMRTFKRRDVGQPVRQNLSENISQNMRQNISQNMGQSKNQNMGQHMGQNMGQSMSQSLRQSLPQNQQPMSLLDILSMHGMRSLSKTRSAPMASASALNSQNGTLTPEEQVGVLVLRHLHRQPIQHGYTASDGSAMGANNLYLEPESVKHRRYASEEQWTNSDLRKLWKQNKLS